MASKTHHSGVAIRQRAFLQAFQVTASVTKAADAAQIDRGQHYEWLESRDYAERFRAAQESAAQVLEDEAVRRAHEGVEEPLVYQGEFSFPMQPQLDEEGHPVLSIVTGQPIMRRVPDAKPLAVRKYSDGLLQFLLRGFRPQKYGTKTAVELSGPGGGPIPLDDQRLATLTDEELESLLTLARKLATAGGDGSGT